MNKKNWLYAELEVSFKSDVAAQDINDFSDSFIDMLESKNLRFCGVTCPVKGLNGAILHGSSSEVVILENDLWFIEGWLTGNCFVEKYAVVGEEGP